MKLTYSNPLGTENCNQVKRKARELLNEWIVKSMLNTSLDSNSEEECEKLSKTQIRREVKKEWDHLIWKTKENNEEESTTNRSHSENIRDYSNFQTKPIKQYNMNSAKKIINSNATLDRILIHQEEVKARRELRKKQKEYWLIQKNLEKETHPPALFEIKKANKKKRMQDIHEESLIQQEIVRVRKEIAEKNISNRKIKNSKQFVHGKTISQFYPSICISESFVDPIISKNKSPSDLDAFRNRRNQKLIRFAFISWLQSFRQVKIRVAELETKVEYRLKTHYFLKWSAKVRQIYLERSVIQTKQKTMESERNAYIAHKFHINYILKLLFTRWKLNVQLIKARRVDCEREVLRRQKEEEFMKKFSKCKQSASAEDNFNETKTSRLMNCQKEYSQNLKKQTETINCLNLAQYKFMSPKLEGTLIKLRKRIVEQNREIEQLKTVNQCTKALLDARDQAMANQMLENATEKINHRLESIKESRSINLISTNSDQNTKYIKTMNHDNEAKSNITVSNIEEIKLNTSPSCTNISSVPINYGRKRNSFLKNIEQRIAERARLREAREERRRIAEQIKKEELAKQLKEEAERIKQEKRSIKLKQLEKKLFEEKLRKQEELRVKQMHELNLKANQYRYVRCLQYYGFLPWFNYVSDQKRKFELAENHRKQTYIKNAFRIWSNHCKLKENVVNLFIDATYLRIFIKRCMRSWKQIVENKYIKEKNTLKWYEQELQRKVLSTWANYMTEIYLRQWKNAEIAQNYYKNNLQKKHFRNWSVYPEIQRKEREREYRRDKFRRLIFDLIPDFSPPNNNISNVIESIL